jgi:chromosome segregation ATPase
MYKGQLDGFEKELRELRARLAQESADAETARQALADERSTTETLGARIGELERQLVAQTTEAEILERRVQELLARLDEQGRFLAEREYSSDQLLNDMSSAQKNEAALRAELADAEARHHAATQSLQTERAQLQSQLKQALAERTKLQEEIATIKREAEAAWASERMENAVMRERINDVAAEVARLTSVLEGPSSPIEAILASETARTPAVPLAPAAGNGDIAAHGGRGSLADRIRALQARASQVPAPSRA